MKRPPLVREVEAVSAEPSELLGKLAGHGIRIYSVVAVDPLTVRFQIQNRDYLYVKSVCAASGGKLQTIRKRGLFWSCSPVLARPVLGISLVILLLAVLFLPTRVFFISVEGNTAVPENQILEAAESCGVRFGVSRKTVRSEKMKNALLSAIPQLQWAGVNTRGCVAVISVSEKTDQETQNNASQVSHIVANQDAVVVRTIVEQGSTLCKVGQAVKAGELLVSGYVDCGISVKATRSVGEIYGQTSRSLNAIIPVQYDRKTGKQWQQKKYGIIIGKKRINFYKDSGILGGTCGKMSTVNYMTLPGGFELPLALVKEVWTGYRYETNTLSDGIALTILGGFADDYLQQQMLAGQVLRKDIAFCCEDGVYSLEGDYSCLEMIGREQSEGTLVNYGKTD